MMLRCYIWQQKWVHHRLIIFVKGVEVGIRRHMTTVERRAPVMSAERGLGIVQSYILSKTVSSRGCLRGFLDNSGKTHRNILFYRKLKAWTQNCCVKSWAQCSKSKTLFLSSESSLHYLLTSKRYEQQLQLIITT